MPQPEPTRPVICRVHKEIIFARKGRGFSLEELRAAKLAIDLAKRLNLRVDFRRKSIHQDNVKTLEVKKAESSESGESKKPQGSR